MQRNWNGHGNPILQKPWAERMRLLAAFLAAAALLVSIVGPTVFTLLLSFKNYMPTFGFSGSPFVGFANYQAVFSAPGLPAALGGSLLLSLLTGLFTCALTSAAFVGLEDTSSLRLRYCLAGAAFLPCLFPVAQIADVFYNFSTYQAAAPFLCAACQAVLAAPYILLILVALKETTGEISLTAVALTAFGGGWYAGASNITVQLTFFNDAFAKAIPASLSLIEPGNFSTLNAMGLPQTGGYSARAILLTVQGVIAKVGLFAVIPLIHNLLTDSVNPTAKNKAIFGKGATWKLALLAFPLLAALLPTIGAVALQTGGSPLNLAPYFRILSPLPGLLLGGALAYFMYKKGKDFQSYGLLAAALILSSLGNANVGLLFFRLFTGTLSGSFPPLDLKNSVLAGFVIMAVCFVYWEKTADDSAWSRARYAAVAALLLIGLGFVNDPAFGLLLSGTANFDLAARASYLSMTATSPVPYALPIVNLVIAAGGVLALEKAMKTTE